MKKSVYVGCSLTNAPARFIVSVDAFKYRLREEGYEVLDFVGLTAGTPADVYQWDIKKCVPRCDLFVAICDYPAIGLGYEIATRVEEHGKPVLAVVKEGLVPGKDFTRLILGINHPNYSFRRYKILEDVVGMVRALLPIPRSIRQAA